MVMVQDATFSYKNAHVLLYIGGAKSRFICQSEATCDPIKFSKFVCGRGSAPDPAGGAYDAPPDSLVGWGGGHPLPDLTPLASILAPSALVCAVTNSV